MRYPLDGGAGRDEAKGELRSLLVGQLPLQVRREGIETVVMGFKVIFPHLTDCADYDDRWCKLTSKLGD